MSAHQLQAQSEDRAELLAPAPGTVLPGQSAVFSWDAGADALAYNLYVGSVPGASDLFDSGVVTTQSATVPILPTNGSTLHVRLWTQLPLAGWLFHDYEFTATQEPGLLSPTPGAFLPGVENDFSWTAIDQATGYQLTVGSAAAAGDLFDSGVITATGTFVTGLPIDGRTVHIRLTAFFATGDPEIFDYTVQTYDIDLDRPDDFAVVNVWSGASLGIPARPGGLFFAPDGNTLYVVGDSETVTSALYAVPVTRDPSSGRVTGLGPAASVTVAFPGDPTVAGLDAGWEFGPDGTLFYTYWDANRIGQRPQGLAGAETLFDLAAIGVPTSVAGLTFSPHLDDANTGFGMMQVSVWQGNDILNIPLGPLGGGLFQPLGTELFVSLPRQGTGALQYVPAGPFAGNLMYVNWDFGEVMMVVIDPVSGLPVDDASGLPTLGTGNPRTIRFASNLGVGPWGLEFDPYSNDFFITTWDGAPPNSIIHFAGQGLPAPTGDTRVRDVDYADGRLAVEWEAPVGWTHAVEFSTDLHIWQNLLTVSSAPAVNRRSFALPINGAPTGFIRIVATAPVP